MKSAALTFAAKLRHCRTRIKEWCAAEFYSVRGEKLRLMREIRDIDREEEQGDLNPEFFSKREDLKSKLSTVLKDEESLRRTRAKQHWLREGDGNTKFFHTIANGRRRANGISMIEEDGQVLRTDEDKKHCFFRKIQEAIHTR